MEHNDGDWKPPATIEELFSRTAGNKMAVMNRPVAGALDDGKLEVGDAPFQLYSLATPNGQKVGILLEELGIEYDAWVISLNKLKQFSQGFVNVNPNSKIPSAVDLDGPGGKPVNLFESGSIMLYLADKYKRFIPQDVGLRAECMNWVFWQMAGQGPMSGNLGHFMVYAPVDKHQARDYGVGRYGMEVQRLCSVLDQHLQDKEFIVGDEYTIADMICLPWFYILRIGYRHPSGVGTYELLNVPQYKSLMRWSDTLLARPAVQRGMRVCRKYGKPWLHANAKSNSKL